MNADQLRKFEERVQSFDEAVTPLVVTIQGQEIECGGSLTDERVIQTEAGGHKKQVESHFTIPKATVGLTRPQLGDLVTISGIEMEVTRVSGLEGYDPNWSIRAERWSNL